MATIETITELVESLAVSLKITGEAPILEVGGEGHWDQCPCRACWCGRMAHRIRAAVHNEDYLTQAQEGR